MHSLQRFRATLAQARFGRWTAGNLLSLIGFWAQRIAIGWLAWELTQSAAWLGLVAAAELLPTLVVTPLAGALADRHPRLKVVRVTQALSAALLALLTLLTLLDLIRIGSLLVLVAAHGIVVAVKQPARMALTRSLVPAAHLATAIAINATVFNLARFLGPMLAGVLLITAGPAAVFASATALYLLMLWTVRDLEPEPVASNGRKRQGLLKDLSEGWRYSVGHPLIGQVMLMQLVLCVAVRAYIELLPAYSDRVVDGGAAGLALLSAGIGMGAILAAFWTAGRDSEVDLLPTVVAAHALSAATLVALAFVDHLALALVTVIVSGFGFVAAGIASQTLLQRTTDDALLGRVLALYGLLFRAGPALGALAMGAAVEGVGFTWSFAISGVIALAWLLNASVQRSIGTSRGT